MTDTLDVSGGSTGLSLRSRIRTWIEPALVWSVWAVALLGAVLYVRTYSRNVPYGEDLYLVSVMTGHEPISWEWSWSRSGEHRAVVPRLILAMLLRTLPDFRAPLYLNVGILSAAAASMIVVVRRLRGRTSVIDAVLPLTIQNIGQCECLLIGFALNLILTTWIALALTGVLARSREASAWGQVLWVGGFVVLLSLSGGSGLVMLPPLVLWLAGYIVSGWWSGRDPGALARALGLGFLMTTTAVVGYYLYGFIAPNNPPSPSPWAACSTMLEVLSLVITPSEMNAAVVALDIRGAGGLGTTMWGYWRAATWGYWLPAAVAVLLLVSLTLGLLAIVGWRRPEERPRVFGLMAVLLSLLMVALAIGISRSGQGPGYGMTSRYVTVAAPILCAVYVVWLLYGPTPARRAIHIGLLVLACIGVPDNVRYARLTGRFRCELYTQIERDLKARVPASRLLDRGADRLFPGNDFLRARFRMLKAARVDKFKHFVDDRFAVAPTEAPTRR